MNLGNSGFLLQLYTGTGSCICMYSNTSIILICVKVLFRNPEGTRTVRARVLQQPGSTERVTLGCDRHAPAAGHAELHWARHFAMKKRWVLSLLVALNLSYARADYFFRLRDAALPNRQVWPDDPSPQPIL